MGHDNHGQAIKKVYIGLGILAVITLIEVIASLFGKGHIGGGGLHENRWVGYFVALVIIGLSLYKAKFIIYEFMHMAYEVPGLVRTVLLPMLLLVWGIIAFFLEGNYWKTKRNIVKTRNEMKTDTPTPTGMIDYKWSSKDFQ